MNVRFKESAIQNLLKKNNQTYVKKAPPVYWLIPVWRQGGDVWILEDENPFYQTLKSQSKLSGFTTMILPNGDVDEVIATTKALNNHDFSEVNTIALRNQAEQILVVAVEYAPDGRWEMHPESYTGTENAFYGLSVFGDKTQSLMDGWLRLNNKMALRWQGQNHSAKQDDFYYARINTPFVSDWGKLEKEFKNLGFLKNLNLQGVQKGQLLIRFSCQNSLPELISLFSQAGWEWISDSSTLGTLKRKDTYENTL